MKRWETLDRARTPEGTDLTLSRSGKDFLILANGRGLMSSDMHGSEEALATFGCVRARAAEAPVVLVGGLGMGFTLRAALDTLPAGATVVVAELLAAVVGWNRGPLGELAGHPLADPRVVVAEGDVRELLARSAGRFDAILLDVDNGPLAFSQEGNASLYNDAGLATARRALAPAGVLAIWTAWDDKKFEHRLRHAGFVVEVRNVRAKLAKGGPKHTIFLGFMDDGSGRAPTIPTRPGERQDGSGRRRSRGPR